LEKVAKQVCLEVDPREHPRATWYRLSEGLLGRSPVRAATHDAECCDEQDRADHPGYISDSPDENKARPRA
jgi:hypothetical protein